MMAVMRFCIDIIWESLASAYKNSKCFKIDVDVVKGDSPNGSKTTTALETNELDDIHVVGNISDCSDETPMKYFLKKGVLKICSKFTGEHPCRSAVSIKLLCFATSASE